jgi:hypothetical protein
VVAAHGIQDDLVGKRIPMLLEGWHRTNSVRGLSRLFYLYYFTILVVAAFRADAML